MKKIFKNLTSVVIVLSMLMTLLPMNITAAPIDVVTVEEAEIPIEGVTAEEAAIPTSIEIDYDADTIDGKVIAKKGDKFKLTAYDQNGEETAVKWKTSSSGVTIDENTGEIEVTADISSGGISYLYFTATSILDEAVKKEIRVEATGYSFSTYQRNQTVALSEDGQTIKTVYITGGVNGHNIWSYDESSKIAQPAKDFGAASSVTFNALRPGQFEISFKIDENEELTDTATVTVTGVAVEDNEGNVGKTYISISEENSAPTMQLSAYVMDGLEVSSWESADETIASVDENGVVTAKSVGSTIISAIDSEGTKGGIKVVVTSEDIPYFESLEFATMAFVSGAWVKDTTFAPAKLSYDLPIRTYSTSSLTLQAATLYDSEKYEAVAEYTDINGEKQSIAVKSGAMTTLANQPFDSSVMTITISDRDDAENKTVYTFNVTRPRDTTKAIKNSGITLVPTGRSLSATMYNGVAEGTMRRADETGTVTSGTGVNSTYRHYRTIVFDDAESFKLNIASSTAYAHIRYSADNGESWEEIAQGGGLTDEFALPEGDTSEILIQILDDKTYTDNVNAGNDGFFEAEPTEYKIWLDKVSVAEPKLLTAETVAGDWYPVFEPGLYSYWIVTENDAEAPILTYTAEDGVEVKIGTEVQIPDENGNYTLTLKTTQTSVTVTSADGNFTSTYKFGNKKKSALDVPDKVVDYLCIGSQYTNGGYGINPEQTLGGSLKSLGNFGGYITYYYEDPITDNPNNKYGMDFYVIGNSQENNIDSMAELGQVYVSEDGNSWYALAGSEHYEDKAIWDYTITYTKGDDGKAYWTDNQGNVIDYAARAWPLASAYYMNNTPNEDSYTFTGVLFESQLGSVMGNSSSTASFASKAKFGYADYYASNLAAGVLADVNSYVEKPSKANGFDVAWAVDENGMPVDVSEKNFHYIKVATASNISAGAFFEKSTEVTYVVRTTAQNTAVGKTAAPTGMTISDGASSKTVTFSEGRNIYSVNLDDMKYVSVKVDGTADDDNIYINNQRVASGNAAQGFKVTKENGETLVRVIVQNGDKEPVIYLLKLTSSATESDELIEGIKINADGTVREAATTDGENYTASVGHRIESVGISLVAAPDVTYTVNGKEAFSAYDLSYGKNTFEITAEADEGSTENITLTITRENAPTSSGDSITVYFTLYGDEEHGDSEVHTYKSDKNSLPVWISKKAYTVPSESTVLDVFEKALTESDIAWENDGGNYISEIKGLAEFDNGALSGWMYFLNSKHSDLGVAEQSLKNGDRIIFHYTDDYTQEQGSEKWSSSGSSDIFDSGITSNNKDGKTDEKNETPIVTDTKACPFNDVNDHWSYDAVKYVYNKSMMQGITEETFAPDENMTRAMLVTVLYRLEKPESEIGASKFVDVPDGEWYSEAVSWAVENGVVTGISDTQFAPNNNVTREQMAAILYRYAQYKEMDTSVGENTNILSYADFNEISEYAIPAMQWTAGSGIMKGETESTLNPLNPATRAQVAAILMRFCENTAK